MLSLLKVVNFSCSVASPIYTQQKGKGKKNIRAIIFLFSIFVECKQTKARALSGKNNMEKVVRYIIRSLEKGGSVEKNNEKFRTI